MDSQLSVSIRSLAEYVYRSGNIDNRFRSPTALQEGTAIHQDVQQAYEDQDEKEVYLETTFRQDDLDLVVHGRCDGVLMREGHPIIDEIKSTSLMLDELESEGLPVHWAQAKSYAYIYALDHRLTEIDVQLTYVQKHSKEKRIIKQTFDQQALQTFMEAMIQEYLSYGRILLHIREQKQRSLPDLGFPFTHFRDGQRKLTGAVYKTIQEKRQLYAQAPTGIGKTISTLFPAIKAMEQEDLHQIFYLTAKTVTRATVEEALQYMKDEGLALRSVTLTAKDKICFQEETICQPDYCEFADGYYDRINGAIIDILQNEMIVTRSVIESYAMKHKVCPFEFSLDVAYVVDVVICDYNYIFDPKVSLKRLMPEDKKQSALLVDEAHNLVERGREMFSASLEEDSFLHISRSYPAHEDKVKEAAESIARDLQRLEKQQGKGEAFVLDEMPGSFEESLDQFVRYAEKELREGDDTEDKEPLKDAYFAAQNFIKVSKMMDESYVIYGQGDHRKLFIKLYCVDPSQLLWKVSEGFRSSVFFSATLSPFAYYKDLLGGSKDDYILKLPSPYKFEEAVDVTICNVSTRYKDRSATLPAIIAAFYQMTLEKPGNHLFFFPSYQYMEQAAEEWRKQTGNRDTIIQSPAMTEEARDEFLDQFHAGGEKIGFAVLGGIFSEGVDLKGDRLTGVAVVGVGLVPRSFERELIKGHFNRASRNGYDYAYVFPGMNKVLQAGGRLIRSEKDEGAIMLVDDRFLTSKYRQLIPDEWRHYRVFS
ncbi:ATP-dependent DNA helicase [Thalassobacillus sp. CUG 92003]|uniref:ATP-dependent DNA helicase n=1 Tax=Thalassobacillus sp. CUG 92003 TaxID=2736641 RepID=UPI0015E6C4FA|nr:ATP-dependent DNA helicase [Thalassobacillus sp. CUG 92003]